MPKIDEYLTVKDAARYLGVAPNTLRAWGAGGKIPMHRNPANAYRLFKQIDLEKFLQRAAQLVKPAAGRKPR